MQRFIQIIEEDERFPFVPEGTDVTFWLRRVTDEKTSEMVERHTRRITNKRTGASSSEIDWAAVARDRLDYALLDWSGVVGSDGKKVQCTRDNKLKLPSAVKSMILEALDNNAPSAGALEEEAKN